jgi:hypothetical protein
MEGGAGGWEITGSSCKQIAVVEEEVGRRAARKTQARG